jgi:hypothetical protein
MTSRGARAALDGDGSGQLTAGSSSLTGLGSPTSLSTAIRAVCNTGGKGPIRITKGTGTDPEVGGSCSYVKKD